MKRERALRAVESGANRYFALSFEWVLTPLFLFALSRIPYTIFLHIGSRFQQSTYPYVGATTLEGYHVYEAHPADPGYWAVSTNWDGQWYQQIAEDGYASVDTAPDERSQWRWAFPPLYPAIVASIMRSLTMPFPYAASLVSLLFGLLASVLIYRLIRTQCSAPISAVATWLALNAPGSPLLQVAYSESLALALLVGALLSIQSRRYCLSVLLILGLGLTRLITLPLVVVLLVHSAKRYRAGDPPKGYELIGLVAATISSVLGTLLWSQVAAALGGGIGANRTSAQVGQYLGGYFRFLLLESALVGVAFMVIAIILIWYSFHPRILRFGTEAQMWTLSYPLFIFLVTPPTTGLFRYLLLAFPLWASAAPVSLQNVRSSFWVIIATISLWVFNYWWTMELFVVSWSPGGFVGMP